MTEMTPNQCAAAGTDSKVPIRYRHTLPVRITHWISVLCLYVLLLSGLQIFNAHPALYWGERSDFDRPWLKMEARRGDDGQMQGVTSVGGKEFNTTGWLGASGDGVGGRVRRGFPAWLTIPGSQWLTMGRRWHFFFAWVLVLSGVIYGGYSLGSGHVSRNLLPTRADWRGLGRSLIDHALLRHPQGEAAARYNVLQKLSYLGVVFGLAPLMVLTGLGMSPRMDTVLGWLVSAVGGRQSMRTLHFILAGAFVLFTLVHLFEVLVTGLVNNLRSMITGYYKIDSPKDESHVSR